MSYFLSPSGNDSNDGLTMATAWKTLQKLSDNPPGPGSTVYFEGGATFEGAIDWAWRNPPVHDVSLEIIGNGPVTLLPPENTPLLSITTPGGISMEGFIIRGRCTRDGVPGILLRDHGLPVQDLKFVGLDVSGFTSAGLAIIYYGEGYGISSVLLDGCRFHHNTNGTKLSGLSGLRINGSVAEENSWNFPFPHDGSAGNYGNGFGVHWSEDVLIEDCLSLRNAIHNPPELVGGPAGYFLQDCDRVLVRNCGSFGTSDPSGLDGQGFLFYGCHDSIVEHCAASGKGTYSFFHDEWCRQVERCVFRYNTSYGALVSLGIMGRVLDCEAYENVLHTDTSVGGYKCLDVAVSYDTEVRRVSVRNNYFKAIGYGAVLLEAVPGIAGVTGLETNRWGVASGATPIFRVRNVDYASLAEVPPE